MKIDRPALIGAILVGASLAAPVVVRAQVPQFITSWGSYGTGNGQFLAPVGVAVDPSGDVYVLDTDNSCVQKFTSGGGFLGRWGSAGTDAGEFQLATGLAVDSNGNVFVAEMGNVRIQEFTSDGSFIRAWGLPNGGRPVCVAVDPLGSVFVSDNRLNTVQKYTNAGVFVTSWDISALGIGVPVSPDGVTTDLDGTVYVCLPGYTEAVAKYSGSGGFLALWHVAGVGVSSAYPVRAAAATNDLLYVTDFKNCRILAYTMGGLLVGQWGAFGSGPGQFESPIGIAVDAGGDVYVADKDNYRIQKFGPLPTPTSTASWGSVKTRYR